MTKVPPIVAQHGYLWRDRGDSCSSGHLSSDLPSLKFASNVQSQRKWEFFREEIKDIECGKLSA